MHVIVVGATGNVGTTLVDVLAADDRITTIRALSRRGADRDAARTTWMQVDITRDNLEGVFRDADVVVHLAWIFQPTHDPAATWRNNVLGSIRVFEAVAAAGVPALVYASSVGAYSPSRGKERVDETWPTHALPTAAYGREKSYLERVLDVFERDHPETRVVRMRPGFIFKRSSAAQQRRLFAGPFLPGAFVRGPLVPFVPDVPGLRFQALHTEDAAEAYRLAVVNPVRGAFNLASEPLVDAAALAELLGARPVHVPSSVLRHLVAAGWHSHLIPASPYLFDLVLSLPTMDTVRARGELGWEPRVASLDAIAAFLEGLRDGAGEQTPPLQQRAGGLLRWREFATGIGSRDRL